MGMTSTRWPDAAIRCNWAEMSAASFVDAIRCHWQDLFRQMMKYRMAEESGNPGASQTKRRQKIPDTLPAAYLPVTY